MPDQPSGEQTAELATIKTDPTRLFGGRLIRRPEDDVLRNQGRGHLLEIYRDLRRDPQVQMALQKRVSQVTEVEWSIEPGKRQGMEPTAEDKRIAELVREQMQALGEEEEETEHASAQLPGGFDHLQEGLLEAILLGFKPAEIVWRVEGSETIADAVKVREERRFRFDGKNRLRLRTQGNMLPGRLLPPRKFIVHTFGSKTDPYGRGLGHQLYWPVFFKRQNMSFWLRFLDKHGGPTVVGKHRKGLDPDSQEVQSLMDSIRKVHTDSAITLPEDMEVDFLEVASKASSADSYEAMKDAMDNAIVKSVLGVTLTSDLDGQGSYAATESHRDEQRVLGKNDAGLLAHTLNNTLFTWLTRYNSDDAVPPVLQHHFPDMDDRKELSTVLVNLGKAGFKPTGEKALTWINKKFAGGEEVFESVSVAQPSNGSPLSMHEMAEASDFPDIDFSVTEAMQENVEQALGAREEQPDSRKGMNSPGLTTADMIHSDSMSPDRWRKAAAWFARHEADKPDGGWDRGEWPPGRQAWKGWGGDEGMRRAQSIVNQMDRAQGNEPTYETPGPRNAVEHLQEESLTQNLEVVDDYVGRLEDEGGPVFDEMLDRIDQELAEADSMGEAVRRIDELYPELNSDDLAEAMERALLAGHGAGQVEMDAESEVG